MQERPGVPSPLWGEGQDEGHEKDREPFFLHYPHPGPLPGRERGKAGDPATMAKFEPNSIGEGQGEGHLLC